MTREELIKLLKSYRENKAKLKLKRKELDRTTNLWILNRHPELEKGITNNYEINNDIKSKNAVSNKIENLIIQSEEKRETALEKKQNIEKEIAELENLIDEAEIRLNSLYYKEREILTAYYVDNRTAEEIGRNLYWKLYNRTCTQQNIYRIIEKATNRLMKL